MDVSRKHHINILHRSLKACPHDLYLFFVCNDNIILNSDVKGAITRLNNINAQENPKKWEKSSQKLRLLFEHYHKEHMGNMKKICKNYIKQFRGDQYQKVV